MGNQRRFLKNPIFTACAIGSGLALLLCLLGAECLSRPLNHDEEQFVASAALLSRQGLLPYVAYPYFHFPNLVFVFAGLFLTNDHLLLTARAFNFACAGALLIVIFTLTARTFAFAGRKRWLIAAAATLSLCFNPFFQFTAGRAWNHDLPTLTTVLGLLAVIRAADSRRPLLTIAASGFLLGVAIGTRLTFLPLILPFLALVWLRQSSSETRLLRVSVFVAALTVALLPTIALLAKAPGRFVFDNLTYNGSVNVRYRQSTVPAEITPGHKLLFPLKQLAKSPSTLAMVGGFIYFGVRMRRLKRWRQLLSSEYGAFVLVLPFLLLGAWIPTPSYRQYYYAVIPFLLLATLFALASLEKIGRRCRSGQFLVAVATLAVLEFIPDLPQKRSLTSPKQWPVFAIHGQGVLIRELGGAGPVLTLAPIFPLEGGATIYKEFTTGPFAWRAAPFVQEENEAQFDLIDIDDLAEYLRPTPPASILTGCENAGLERPLIEYAKAHGYRPKILPAKEVLWVRSP